MRAIRLAWLELRRFRGPVRRVVPLLLIAVPMLCAGLFLWSNWDPFGRLTRIPVAVTSADRPVDDIDAGARFVQHLKAYGTFDWHFVTPLEARRGLVQGRYYFTVEVPPDFSAKLADSSRPDAERAQLRIIKNDANGFLAGVLADSAGTELQEQINSAAHTAFARARFGDLHRAREQLLSATDTAKKLTDTGELNKQGTAALTRGLGGTRDGAGLITQGAHKVSGATAQLAQQLATLDDYTADDLPKSVNALVEAGNTALSGLHGIQATTGYLSQQATETRTAIEQLGASHPEIARDPGYQHALLSARGAADTATRADTDARQALSAAQDANGRAVAIQQSMGALQANVHALDTPANTLREGAASLAGGAQGVTSGLNTLLASAGVLQNGTGQLTADGGRLHGQLDDSLGRIPQLDPAEVTDVLGMPAEIHTDNLHPAGSYGRGQAPLLFAIAIWVAGMLAFLLFGAVNPRALMDRLGAWTIAVAGFLPVAVLVALGGLVLLAFAELGLGLRAMHLDWTAGLLVLGAAAFVAVDHFLRVALGGLRGGLASAALLIVQVTASGGLYPVETMPMPVQVLHPFLPMSHLVGGLRVTISGGTGQRLIVDALLLAGFLLVFLALSGIAVARRRAAAPARLHSRLEPAISV